MTRVFFGTANNSPIQMHIIWNSILIFDIIIIVITNLSKNDK